MNKKILLSLLVLFAMPFSAANADIYNLGTTATYGNWPGYGYYDNPGYYVGNQSVSITDNLYSPSAITVTSGSTVTWTNSGAMPHTVTATNGNFNSGNINPGGVYTYTFYTPGTFEYYCTLHPSMRGTVTVVSQDTYYPYTTNTTNLSTLNSISGTVTGGGGGFPGTGNLVINQIIPIRTTGVANGSFESGWAWTFDVSAPYNETSLMMKFGNWFGSSGFGNFISQSNNIRFFSAQSSNAAGPGNAIYVLSPDTYSSPMYLTGNLDSGSFSRRVQITVQVRIPTGTPSGTYSTNFGIQTQ